MSTKGTAGAAGTSTDTGSDQDLDTDAGDDVAGDLSGPGAKERELAAENDEWAKFKAGMRGRARSDKGEKPGKGAKDKAGGKGKKPAKPTDDDAGDDAGEGDAGGDDQEDEEKPTKRKAKAKPAGKSKRKPPDDDDGDTAEAGDESDEDDTDDKPAAGKARGKSDDDDDGDGNDETDDGDEGDDDAGDDADDEDEDEDEQEVKLDAKGKKQLEAVQRAQRKHTAQVEKDNAKLKADRDEVKRVVGEWAPRIDRFEKLSKQVATRPAAVLELLDSLGVKPEARAAIGSIVYASSPEAAKDPKWSKYAAQLTRETSTTGEVAELQKRIDAMEKRDKEREQQATYQRSEAEYLDRVVEAIGEDAPLARITIGRLRKKAKDATLGSAARKAARKGIDRIRGKLRAIAVELSEGATETPDIDDVVALFEQRHREELEDSGVDVDAMLKAARKKKPKDERDDDQDDDDEERKPKKKGRSLSPAGGGAGSSKDDKDDGEIDEDDEWEKFKQGLPSRRR